MPEIKIQSVSSCSSEDQRNPAENLLKEGGSYKWKSAAAGEKSVSVVLKLEKASQIHSIDIGNEGSAFVEVLVGKEFDTNFEVLLVASSFMTPLESRNGTNKNGVRMFGQDKLNKTTASQKWDRVKVVCTQPFSKTSPYGLSFIKFHSPPENKDPEPKTQIKLGHFTLKAASDDDDDIPAGSLFANRSKIEQPSPSVPAGAAAIRVASKKAEQSQASPTRIQSEETRKRRTTSPPPSAPPAKTSRANSSEDPSPKPTLKKQSTSLSSVSSSGSSTKPEKSALKKIRTEPATPTSSKPFGKLMDKVVFVLSGFENPFRRELRDKACEMGAQYKPDWGRGCTHLICAFANTPKYKQVVGKGKIVTKSWILDSHKQKRLMPWRKYRLGDAESPSESSEEEEEVRKTPAKPQQTKPSEHKAKPVKDESEAKPASYDDDEDGSDSGSDTEDELLKVKAVADKQKNEAEGAKGDNPYAESTDEDEPSTKASSEPTGKAKGGEDGSDSGLPDLPDFFADKHFFFYGDFPAAEQRLLTRYIAAYNGEVEDYMSKRVKYVITAQQWDENFEDALSENSELVFVKPKWIFTCHEKAKLVPYQPYIVVPK